MSTINENAVETMAINLLQGLGYHYIYGPDIEPSGIDPLRDYKQVLLPNHVLNALKRLNPHLSHDKCEEAFKKINNLVSTSTIENNLQFHRLLTEGISVEITKDGNVQGDLAWLIDFKNPDNNEFIVMNQITIRQNRHTRRPDVILYINGLPLVVMELKNPTDENATITDAFNQIQTYQDQISSLFTYNVFNIISDGLEAKAGTVSADYTRYMTWKIHDHQQKKAELKTLIEGMLNPVTLLDIIRHFVLFEQGKHIDSQGIRTIKTIKKMAAYHQYYAVNAAILSTMRASNISTASMSVQSAEIALRHQGKDLKQLQNQEKAGDHKAGVVWHTQGSGKSLSMVFYAGKIVLALNNPTLVIITDRNDLDDQLFSTFSSATQLLRQPPKQAETREQLKEYLRVASGGIIFTTIQKFQPNDGETIYEMLSERENIIVIADEAHRSQYGFKAKEVDIKNEENTVIGKRTVYGFAKYLRDALPNATYLGFTGTPIETADVNTPAVFGNYVDIYDIAQAVEDGATVRIFYESRLAKVKISDEGRQLIQEFDNAFDDETLTQTQKERAKWARIEGIIGSKNRIKAIAADIVQHFEQRLVANAHHGKGMIVTMSRRIAVDLYNEIIAIKPEWHHDDLEKGVIKIVMTSAASDGPEIAKHHTTKKQRQDLALRMKDDDNSLKLVIVRDMWLTGFDVPSLHSLYIDKPMKGHNLMQAIARVNRVYKDKIGGLVIDYLGIASDLQKALSFYSDAGGKGDPAQIQEDAVNLMQEKLEVVRNILYGFNYQEYFHASTARKLDIILETEDHILGIDTGQGKNRFLIAVSALSRAFALAVPHPDAMEIAEDLSFFQDVKARLNKFNNLSMTIENSDNTNIDIELRVKQTIDEALVTESVVDIFDAAGIQKPDISILSEDFLMEMKNYQHKNIALETLKKLLMDEIKIRENKSIIESKKLMEMLNNTIQGYQNKILTAVEVIDELIKLAKSIHGSDDLAKELHLTDYEYAFYTAVANNDSARELMQKEALRELAVVLTQAIRQNITLDWTVKEAARAKIRVIVKRLLKKYGYPPDMSILATETVLQQAELLASDLL